MSHSVLQESALSRLEGWLAEEGRSRSVQSAGDLLESVNEAGRGLCRYEWNGAGDLVRITEADGSSKNYEYDEQRRLTFVRHSDGSVSRYRYDGAGRLAEIDSREQRRRFEYDELGRPCIAHRGNAGAVVYRYDAQGRVVEYRTAVISCEQEYDADGRVVLLRQTLGGVSLEIRQQYDAKGRLARMILPGALIDYEWEKKGRPVRVLANGSELAQFEYSDSEKTTRIVLSNGVVESSRADRIDGRPVTQEWSRNEKVLGALAYSYTAAGKIASNGLVDYSYDGAGRLKQAECHGAAGGWRCDYAAMRNGIAPLHDGYTFDEAGQLTEVRRDGELIAQFSYDGKGRVALMRTCDGTERYLYGPSDELLAVTDANGTPLRQYVRTPLGCLAELAGEETHFYHQDERGASHFVTDNRGELVATHICDPYGVPLAQSSLPPWFAGRIWNPVVELYYFGARWYDPRMRAFLTPDTYTAAPDDERLMNPLLNGAEQVWLRGELLRDWLRHPRSRNLYAFCSDDPVNCVDPNGHWSFGRVLLMILGAIWTLPNTIFGLLIEITCLVGEVVRWLVWLVTAGNVSWATPGFDVAASGRLNAFALVFKGGWLGSFSSLLGITFGNVFFVYKDWESDPTLGGGGDVSPTAYGGSVTFPVHDALYEHELRHTVQYGWFGPFFHLGLPVFGIYEWDVILHGYRNSWLESNARAYGGI